MSILQLFLIEAVKNLVGPFW